MRRKISLFSTATLLVGAQLTCAAAWAETPEPAASPPAPAPPAAAGAAPRPSGKASALVPAEWFAHRPEAKADNAKMADKPGDGKPGSNDGKPGSSDGKPADGKPAAGPASAETKADGKPGKADDLEGIPPLSAPGDMSREQAEGYNKARPAMYPMTPGMIRQFRGEFDAQQRAAFGSKQRPQAIVDAVSASLEPGARPPTLIVSPGMVSTIDFFDVSGQPWPFTGYIIGDKEKFQILQLGEGGNFLSIAPNVQAGSTNLVVSLKPPAEGGSVPPLTLTILIDPSRAHYRHDVRIQALGPNARTQGLPVSGTTGGRPGDAKLLAVLAATELPDGAKPVAVSFLSGAAGAEARGWIIDDALYLRTRMALLSPSWTDSLAGPDDMRVYRLAKTPVVLFSSQGRVLKARIETETP